MKILIFSNSPIRMKYLSGTGNWVITLIEQLMRKPGIALSVAFHDSYAKCITRSHANGIELFGIPVKSKGSIVKQVLHSWLCTDPFSSSDEHYREIVEETKPDIIHIFGLESPFIRILRWKNDNVIVHIQGFLPSYIYKYYPRFSDLELVKTMTVKDWLKGNMILKKRRLTMKHIMLEDSIYDRILHVFGRTDWDRRCMKAISPQAKYFYAHEIMREQFYKAQWTPPHNSTRVLYTTIRDNWVKNVDMIFETAAILDRYNPSFLYEWRVAGVSPNDTTPKIMKKRRVGSPKIALLGRLSSDQIVVELLNADLFVYPSSIENGCNAVQEAMLCGIPILCTYAGGMSNTIENNFTGVSISEGDPYLMAGSIIEIFAEYDKSISLGINARKISMKRHDPGDVVDCVMQAYAYIARSPKNAQSV